MAAVFGRWGTGRSRASGRSLPLSKVYLTKNVVGFKQMDMLAKWTAAPLIMSLWAITFRFYLGFEGRGSRIGIDQFATRLQD